MPVAPTTDVVTLTNQFAAENAEFGGLTWELEDLICNEFLTDFEVHYPHAVAMKRDVAGRTHWEFTRPGKFQLHQFVAQRATLDDLIGVVRVIRALRSYLGLRYDDITC
jgi:hypothetical protein